MTYVINDNVPSQAAVLRPGDAGGGGWATAFPTSCFQYHCHDK